MTQECNDVERCYKHTEFKTLCGWENIDEGACIILLWIFGFCILFIPFIIEVVTIVPRWIFHKVKARKCLCCTDLDK
jgi:hypothetical protein